MGGAVIRLAGCRYQRAEGRPAKQLSQGPVDRGDLEWLDQQRAHLLRQRILAAKAERHQQHHRQLLCFGQRVQSLQQPAPIQVWPMQGDQGAFEALTGLQQGQRIIGRGDRLHLQTPAGSLARQGHAVDVVGLDHQQPLACPGCAIGAA